jgi:hypothetical protein
MLTVLIVWNTTVCPSIKIKLNKCGNVSYNSFFQGLNRTVPCFCGQNILNIHLKYVTFKNIFLVSQITVLIYVIQVMLSNAMFHHVQVLFNKAIKASDININKLLYTVCFTGDVRKIKMS